MSIEDWILKREQKGIVTFSIEDVRTEFALLSKGNIKTTLHRLVGNCRIQSVYRGFYVVVPVHYQLKGFVPVEYYIEDLMRYLHKPYYVGLLSAAAIYGATHQKAMVTQVMTVAPITRNTNKNLLLSISYRSAIDSELLVSRNGEMSIIKYSSPELTATDLIQYADNIGGYQRAATVLSELVDELDISKMGKVLSSASVPTMQRLGFILENILFEKEKADQLFDVLVQYKCVRKSILLSTRYPRNLNAISNRWHVNDNIEIVIDEI